MSNSPQLSLLWLVAIPVLVLGLFAIRVYRDTQKLNQPSAATTLTTPTTSPQAAITISPQDPTFGSPHARLTLVEFADLGCPACAQAASVLASFVGDHFADVRLVWKDFVLPVKPESQNAAEAAQCAASQGKFWEYQSQLFVAQNQLGSTLYDSLAQQLKLDQLTFNQCRSSHSPQPLISFNQQQAKSLGLTETPSLFVNGRLYQGTIDQPSLEQLLAK